MKNLCKMIFIVLLGIGSHPLFADGLKGSGGSIGKAADLLTWIDSLEFENGIEYVNSEDFETIANAISIKKVNSATDQWVSKVFEEFEIEEESDYSFMYIPENVDNSHNPESISVWDFEQQKSVYIINEDSISVFSNTEYLNSNNTVYQWGITSSQ